MEKHNVKKVVLLTAAIILLGFAVICHDVTKIKNWQLLVEFALSLIILGTLLSQLKNKSNSVKVILVTMLVFFILTWILPAAYFSGEYVDQGRVQMGLFDLFNYPLTALSYFGYIAFYLIFVGGFYGVLGKIPAYRTFLDKIVGATKGIESLVLSIFVIVNALLVSICGVHIGIALFIPFIVSIVFLMGYDKIVAAYVTVGSIISGLIGTTFASANITILTGTFSLQNDYQIGVRIVLLLASVALVIFNMLSYIKRNEAKIKAEKKSAKKVEEKVVVEEVEVKKKTTTTTTKKNTSTKGSKSTGKKTTKSSNSRKNYRKAALKDEDVIVVKEGNAEDKRYVPEESGKKHSTWPIFIMFALLFVLFVLAFVTWGEKGFGIDVFDKATEGAKNFKLFGFPLFSKLMGTINSFGNWSITDMLLPMTLVLLLLVIVYKVPFEDVRLGFKQGAKRALGPATIAILLYSILVLVVYHPFQLPIYKAILELVKGFNVATTSLVAFLCGFFNADISYSFQSIVPYYASVVTATDNYGIAAIIFQSMYGLAMLVVPTSLVLMGTLSYLKISYKEWWKIIWKLALELFVILLIVFIILALI